jgi:hypothetical protein
LLSRFLFISFHFLVVYWNPSGASLLTGWLTVYLPQSGIMFISHLHSHNCSLVVSAECEARLCWPHWRHWC